MKKFLYKTIGKMNMRNIILLVVVLFALITLRFYFKRCITSHWHSTADDIGEQYIGGSFNVMPMVHITSNVQESYDQGVVLLDKPKTGDNKQP